ncbi:glycosyltransferase family protein [Paenibacillus sp. MABNR03]|uniref:glycosyltransferase family protein n=1 Tax=Paenibacillus sp. MABNR03 TaxID=3142626 RepID=UPI003D2BF761
MVIKKKRRMQVKSQKNKLSVQHPNQRLLRQMNATLNRKLKSIQHHLTIQQRDLQQHLMKILQDGHRPPKVDPPKVVYKQLNVLLITPCMDREISSMSVLLEQSLRHLVKNIYEIKTIQPIETYLDASNTDLILLLGGEEALPEENIEALRASPIKKAIWLSDPSGVKHLESVISLFDYVFTQDAANIPSYQRMGNALCYEVPFPPNPNVFYPQTARKHHESDVYIIGDAQPGSGLFEFANHALLSGKKVRVEGKGWKRYGAFIPVQAHEDREWLYNGAKIVIQDNSSIRSMLEVAACGTFQLISISSTVDPDTDVFQSYNSLEQLVEKFDYYWNQVDQRRLAASRAMAYVKYNHSYFQKSLQLLDRIFR